MPPVGRTLTLLSNIAARLSDNIPKPLALILNISPLSRKFTVMKNALAIFALAWALSATAASAACVAEYKAKRDNPLRLDYGTVTVPGNTCTKAAVRSAVRAQLASKGWTLLSILSVREAG